MHRLLLLGGPPGVGKTTVAPLLADRLAPCAWVEGDELWRMSPTVITDRTRAMVEANIAGVLTQFLAAAYERVFLSWVLHRRDLVERILAATVTDGVDARVVHLVATPEVLQSRLAGRTTSVAVALERLASIRALSYEQIDTTTLTPDEVADRVAAVAMRSS